MKPNTIKADYFGDNDLYRAVRMCVWERRLRGTSVVEFIRQGAQSATDVYIEKKVKKYRAELHKEIRALAVKHQNVEFEDAEL